MKSALCLLLLLLVLVMGCSIDSVAGGSGTETTGGGLCASVKMKDGSSAQGAVVRILPSEYEPVTDSPSLDLPVAYTDYRGRFSFSELPPGEYAVEAIVDSVGILLVRGSVRAGQTTDLGTHALQLPGRLRVSVRRTNIPSDISLKAGLVGTRRIARALNDSTLAFDTVAPADYSVLLTSSKPEVTGTTTLENSVSENELTRVRDVSLPIDVRVDSVAVAEYLGKQGIPPPYPLETFAEIKQNRIRTLFLRNRGITQLNPEIGNLTFLDLLVLDSNALTTLPDEIVGMGLSYISLDHNPLNQFPEALLKTDISAVSLDGTGITSLPPEFADFDKMKDVSMARNGLVDVPSVLFGLTTLQFLNLAGNQITHLPPEIGGLTKLEMLTLSGNTLKTVPPEIGNLKSLRHLFLYSNQIDSIPGEIGGCTSLTSIHLYQNNLVTLPAGIAGCVSLNGINIIANEIDSLPLEVMNLPADVVIKPGNNKLCNLPAVLSDWLDSHTEGDWRSSQRCD